MDQNPLPMEAEPLPIPEREEALGKAAALWLAGHSKRAACREVGVSRTTLSRYMDANGWTKADRSDYTGRVAELAYQAAEESGRQLLERLEGKDNLNASQLSVVFGITADKLAKMSALAAPQDKGAQLTDLIRTLHERGSSVDLKLEVKSPVLEREVVEVGSER